MLLLLLAYLGGVLTIFSPCVLPVIPFLFSRSQLSFMKSGLPTLIGMGLSFTVFGILSAAGGSWVGQINQGGRTIAMAIFFILGLTLLFPSIAQKVMQPFVNLGGAMQKRAQKEGSGTIVSSLLIGASVGLLWAPCAGPILGLILAASALSGLSEVSFVLLFTFALGAATSLAIAILASGKVLNQLKRGLGVEEWIKKGLGVIVLASVIAIALGWDTKFLAKFSFINTNSFEQKLIALTRGETKSQPKEELSDEGPVPPLEGAISWLNSSPLTREGLQGKVVLIDFWTYSCINCLRTLPYIKHWADAYKDKGLVVIGVHSPEFAFEKDAGNVARAVTDLGITYPVAIDSNLTLWNAFKNQYWPAHYFIDAKGRIRHHHFGEGGYEDSERVLQKLLKEAHPDLALGQVTPDDQVVGQGVEQAPGVQKEIASPETYLGFGRQKGFSSNPAQVRDAVASYSAPVKLGLNQWALQGSWIVSEESVRSAKPASRLSMQFKARDLNLVLGNPQGPPRHIRVKIDGKNPGEMHGSDIDADGNGTVTSHRLYQLIRQRSGQDSHLFEIEFLDEGTEAFAFTFG